MGCGRRERWLMLSLAFVLSLILANIHVYTIDRPHVDGQRVSHQQIADHVSPAPYQYRVLQPMLVELGLRALGFPPGDREFLALYAAIRVLCTWVLFVSFFAFLRRWFPPDRSALGTMIVAVLIPFTYRKYGFQPSSIMELACFALALNLIAGRRGFWLTLVTLVGTLNRETMIFVPFLYLLWWWPRLEKTDYVNIAAGVAAWAAPFFVTRALWPTLTNLTLVGPSISHNITDMLGNVDVALMIVPWVTISLFARYRAPSPFRRTLWFYAAWVPVHFVFSLWDEVRYYLPPLLLTVPGMLSALFPDETPYAAVPDLPRQQTGDTSALPSSSS